MTSIKQTDFKLEGSSKFYRGKVRDVYFFKDRMLVVVTDRISAFDVVLPKAIPYKGQVLNQIANYFLEATRDIVENWVLQVPDPMVTYGIKCQPYKIEMVIRGYLAGHAWREYKKGKRTLCGVKLPDGLHENDKLPEPIVTPSTKAEQGHDKDISKEDIISKGLAPSSEYQKMEEYTYKLFQRGSEMAAEKGLLLVDTKYEFGKKDNKLYLIDEIHTPDSSRYFYAEGYDERQKKAEPQKQLSKEFVRQWLIENGFQGNEGQKIPFMSDEFVTMVSERYIELYEKLTDNKFNRITTENLMERILKNCNNLAEGNKITIG